MMRSRWSAASPTTSSSSAGPTRSGTTAVAPGRKSSLADFRKDLLIEIQNEAGQVAISYKVYRCWVSEFQAVADLDANANAVPIQHIKLENEGWERDQDVTEPTEPTFNDPVLIHAAGQRQRAYSAGLGAWRRASRGGSGSRGTGDHSVVRASGSRRHRCLCAMLR